MFYIYADGEALSYPMDEELTVINPKLTLEIGKAGSLTFGLPPTNRKYDQLRKLKTVITVEYGDEEIFRGRIISEERNFSNVKTFYCEGILAYLLDSEQENLAYTGTTHGLFLRILSAHNARMEPEKKFTLGDLTAENRHIIISGKSEDIQDAETGKFNYKQIAINASTNEWQKTYDYIMSCLIGYCGGYLRARHADGVNYLDYVSSYGRTSTQDIQFGVNLLDLVDESNVDDLITVLIPLGDDNLKITSVNHGSDELVDSAAVETYGRIVRTHVFENVDDPSTLLENGRRYLASHVQVPVTVTVKAVDMNMINPYIQEILIGDRVHVKSAPHGVVDYLTCSKIEYDLENQANTLYTFGVPKQSLTERYKQDKQKASDDASRSGSNSSADVGEATEEEMANQYAEWINIDPNDPDGIFSLGALKNKVKGIADALQRKIGINVNTTGDINPATGLPYPGLDIYDMDDLINENNEQIGVQGARIRTYQSETQASMNLMVSRHNELAQTEQDHWAAINIIANDLESAIDFKADSVSVESDLFEISQEVAGVVENIATFTHDITSINSEITKVRKLIADEIAAMKGDVKWLSSSLIEAKSVNANQLTSRGYIDALQGIRISGKPVATQEWVDQQGYLKNNGVSWGNVNTSLGHVYATIDGVTKCLAMASHSHPTYLTSLPSHRHTFSGSCTLYWSHSHANNGAGGVNNYAPKTLTISGNTGYSS